MAQFYNLSSGVSTIFNKTFVHILWSYSWYEYLWSAPWGLEIMAGTEGCYVEESIAGRMFNLFYDFAYNKTRDILEKIGISDTGTRYGIAVRSTLGSPAYARDQGGSS